MKILKIIDLILLFASSIIGVVYEIYPPIIPDWLFNTMWIVGPIALIIFVVLYAKRNKDV